MVSSASLFSQILFLIDRNEFGSLVSRFKAEKAAKGFSCWGQFVAKLFCQLAQARTLREIEGGLKSCEGLRDGFKSKSFNFPDLQENEVKVASS